MLYVYYKTKAPVKSTTFLRIFDNAIKVDKNYAMPCSGGLQVEAPGPCGSFKSDTEIFFTIKVTEIWSFSIFPYFYATSA